MTNLKIGRAGTVITLSIAVALAASACTATGDSTPAASATQGATQVPGTVAVTLREWSVEASPAEAVSGEITFDVSNEGALPHNFVVFSTELAPDALPVENAQVVENEAVEEVARIDEFGPGSSESVTVRLEAGAYVLVCNLPGHYEQGMHTGFSVGR